jgi:hypothetical protein
VRVLRCPCLWARDFSGPFLEDQAARIIVLAEDDDGPAGMGRTRMTFACLGGNGARVLDIFFHRNSRAVDFLVFRPITVQLTFFDI